MTNGEKFKGEILKIINRGECFGISCDKPNVITECDGLPCEDCLFNLDGSCEVHKMKWLLSEYKEPIKLTRLEYELLKFLNDEGSKYIARDLCGQILYRYRDKPTKNKMGEWVRGGTCIDLRMFNNLFQFVKWEDAEPTSIQEVLDNFEVVENEIK